MGSGTPAGHNCGLSSVDEPAKAEVPSIMSGTAKKKMLYIMGVDWDWIYQRPQILAEKLDRDFDVTVAFPRKIYRKPPAPDRRSTVRKLCFPILPLQEKNRIVGLFGRWLYKIIFRDYQQYDYIYIGYPLYGGCIPKDYDGCVIYDCMDNHQAMLTAPRRIRRIAEQEEELVGRCRLLLASSETLRRKTNRVAGYDKAVLVRNGTGGFVSCPVKKPAVRKVYDIGYIGTIAEWFDYRLLQSSAEKNRRIRYHLIGPVLNRPAENEAIRYEGILPHDRLASAVENYDCLVMPFLVNDIVSSVDPVKLYEYIAFGKCIISVYYSELEHFRDFVYFYHTEEEYLALVEELCRSGFPAKYNETQRAAFLAANDWEERYRILKKAIDGAQAQPRTG